MHQLTAWRVRSGSRLCENVARYDCTRNFEACGHVQSKKMQKFVLRSALRPNQISFLHGLGQNENPPRSGLCQLRPGADIPAYEPMCGGAAFAADHNAYVWCGLVLKLQLLPFGWEQGERLGAIPLCPDCLRCLVSDGVSPKAFLYRTPKLPSSRKPNRIAACVTVPPSVESTRLTSLNRRCWR
jgi:hypothetical protein